MTNGEICKKAFSKVKVKHLTAMSVISYGMAAVSLLGMDLTGNGALDLLIGLALGTAVCLGAFCGMNRVSMTAWRSGKAEYAEFFGGYTPGGFARCILPAVIGGMMLTLMRRFVLGGSWWLALITAAVLCVAGNVPRGIALAALYAVIAVVRSVLEPKIVAAQVGLPPLVALAAMYVGFCIVGVAGMILLPLAVLVVKQLHDGGFVGLWR